MPKATLQNGKLKQISSKCFIDIPNYNNSPINLKILPDISDSKSASYNDEPILGRSFPLKTYSHSENRSISMQIHLLATDNNELSENINILRAIESATYPLQNSQQTPFEPPPVCKIQCGPLLGEDALCVILKNYSVKFPTDVPWVPLFQGGEDYVPIKFDIDTQWDVVYTSDALPGQERIINRGR